MANDETTLPHPYPPPSPHRTRQTPTPSNNPSTPVRDGDHLMYIPSPIRRGGHRLQDGLPQYLHAAYHASLPPESLSYTPPPMCGRKFQKCAQIACGFIIGLILLVPILILLDLIVLYVVDHIRFEIRSVSTTEFTKNSTGGVQVRWDITVAARNPNAELKAEFRNMHIILKNKNTEIGGCPVPGFPIQRMSETVVNGTMVVSKERMERMRDGDVELELEIRSEVELKDGKVSLDTFDMDAKCIGLGTRHWSGRQPCETEGYNGFKEILRLFMIRPL